MGLYTDDVSRLGMVSEDAMRAARLVVDTGVHAKGWSRDRMVDYMHTNTATAPVEIDSGADRYICAPGQAARVGLGMIGVVRRSRARSDLVPLG
jgi:uncharacterized protein (DUF885 family)